MNSHTTLKLTIFLICWRIYYRKITINYVNSNEKKNEIRYNVRRRFQQISIWRCSSNFKHQNKKQNLFSFSLKLYHIEFFKSQIFLSINEILYRFRKNRQFRFSFLIIVDYENTFDNVHRSIKVNYEKNELIKTKNQYRIVVNKKKQFDVSLRNRKIIKQKNVARTVSIFCQMNRLWIEKQRLIFIECFKQCRKVHCRIRN